MKWDHLTLSKATDNPLQSQIWGISHASLTLVTDLPWANSAAAPLNYHIMHSFCCKKSYSGFCSDDNCRPNVGQTLTCAGQSCINGMYYSFSHRQPFKCFLKAFQEWYNLTYESARGECPAVPSFCSAIEAVRSLPLHWIRRYSWSFGLIRDWYLV